MKTIERVRFEDLWSKLKEIPVNDNDELEADFEQFEAGSSKFEVWHWLERKFNICVGNEGETR